MISYIYLSSDTQLMNSNLIPKNQINIYFAPYSMEHFFFENHFDLNNQYNSSCSKHFSEAVHQVFSITEDLPKKYSIPLQQQSKKLLHELFNYLVYHFENTQASYVEILFCSKGSENEPLFQEKLVSYEWLSVDDLYQAELKFIRIDTKMTEFVFRRKIA